MSQLHKLKSFGLIGSFRSLGLQVHCTCQAKKYSYSEAQNATLVLAQGLASCIFLIHPLCFSVVKNSIIFVLQGPPRGELGELRPLPLKIIKSCCEKVFSAHPAPPPSNSHFESVFSSYTFNEPPRFLSYHSFLPLERISKKGP